MPNQSSEALVGIGPLTAKYSAAFGLARPVVGLDVEAVGQEGHVAERRVSDRAVMRSAGRIVTSDEALVTGAETAPTVMMAASAAEPEMMSFRDK